MIPWLFFFACLLLGWRGPGEYESPGPLVVNVLRRSCSVTRRYPYHLRTPEWWCATQVFSRQSNLTDSCLSLSCETLNRSLASTLNVSPDCHKYNRKSLFYKGFFINHLQRPLIKHAWNFQSLTTIGDLSYNQ